MSLNLVFQLFCILLVFGVVWLNKIPLERKEIFDRNLFCVASSLLVAYCAFRPLGVALDDSDYAGWIYTFSCPTLECGKIIQSHLGRDHVWYSLVGLIKSFYPTPRIVLWVAASALIIKLWVIERLCQHRSLALLFYVALFYLIHDITALRVSLAISIFLLAFYALVLGYFRLGAGLLLVNGFFHKQAFFAPLLLVGRGLTFHPEKLSRLLLVPLALLILGLYPNKWILEGVMSTSLGNLIIGKIAGSSSSYINALLKGAYEQVRTWPIVAPPTLFLAIWFLKDLYNVRLVLYQYAAASIIIASWLLWACGVIPDVQLRLWHFFLVPIVFLIGNAHLNFWKITAILCLIAVYVLKYTFLHDLLLDAPLRKLRIDPPSSGGRIVNKTLGIPCDDDDGIQYHQKSEVVLTAIAEKGYRFDRWTGGCESAQTLHCRIIMGSDQVVGVAFKPVKSLSLISEGLGVVGYRFQGKDKSCKPPCSISLDDGSEVELSAKAAMGYRLLAWSNSCHGTDRSCKLIMSEDKAVKVTFIRIVDIALSTSIGGKIVEDVESGFECQHACKESVDFGTTLRLRAMASDGYRFVKWGDGCQGEQLTCMFTPQGPATISAVFEPVLDKHP